MTRLVCTVSLNDHQWSVLENRDWESVFMYEMWTTEVWYHSPFDGSTTIHMGSITMCSKGTGLPTAIKLDWLILGEIYEALSTVNHMEIKKPFLHPHSPSTRENIRLFPRWCSHCNLCYILSNCGLCWAALLGNCKSSPGWATTKFTMCLSNPAFNILTTVCR